MKLDSGSLVCLVAVNVELFFFIKIRVIGLGSCNRHYKP